jgi:GNAT superfamily N-acetyltransferase
MTGTTVDRARHLWCTLAAAPVEFPPSGVTVVVSPAARLCPPGWCGIVVLGESAIATVPTAALKPLLEYALHLLPAPDMTDPHRLRAVLPLSELLGPAALAYLEDPAPPGAAGHRAIPAHPGEAEPPGAVVEVPRDDPGLAAFLAAVPPDDAGESGLAELTSAAFVTGHEGEVTAAAGWRLWPTGVAHLGVLTDPAHRGRGLARAVAARATADALAAGLLPQWRARPLASRRVARALGFRELGSQFSFTLNHPSRSSAD